MFKSQDIHENTIKNKFMTCEQFSDYLICHLFQEFYVDGLFHFKDGRNELKIYSKKITHDFIDMIERYVKHVYVVKMFCYLAF